MPAPISDSFPERVLQAYASRPDDERESVLYLDQRTVDVKLDALARLMPPGATFYYAVKTNPNRQLLAHLATAGCGMDIASRAELDKAMGAGTAPEKISYGNTLKHPRDIAAAHRAGVTLFSADSENELTKIAANAPGARIWLRTAIQSDGVVFTLTQKYGASPDAVPDLAAHARKLGLDVHGLSFHVGSQQTTAHAYATALATVHSLIIQIPVEDHPLTVNIGGGLPGYGYPTTPGQPATLDEYADTFHHWYAVTRQVHPETPWAAEPGRFLVADAGIMATRVLDINRRPGYPDYLILEVGRYSGLSEADLLPPYITAHPAEAGKPQPYIVAGPTCDTADTLGDAHVYRLPDTLQAGDPILVHTQGAYSVTCASQNFNGLPNPTEEWLPGDV